MSSMWPRVSWKRSHRSACVFCCHRAPPSRGMRDRCSVGRGVETACVAHVSQRERSGRAGRTGLGRRVCLKRCPRLAGEEARVVMFASLRNLCAQQLAAELHGDRSHGRRRACSRTRCPKALKPWSRRSAPRIQCAWRPRALHKCFVCAIRAGAQRVLRRPSRMTIAQARLANVRAVSALRASLGIVPYVLRQNTTAFSTNASGTEFRMGQV